MARLRLQPVRGGMPIMCVSPAAAPCWEVSNNRGPHRNHFERRKWDRPMKKKISRTSRRPRRSAPGKSKKTSAAPAQPPAFDLSKHPSGRFARAGGDLSAFVSVTGCIEQSQMLLMRKVKKAIGDRSVQKAIGAKFAAWTNKDAAKAQKRVGGLLDIPGAQDHPDHSTFVIWFPLHTAVGPLQTLHDYLREKTTKTKQSKRKGGLVRGADISASIGKKFERIRSTAEEMKRQGLRPTKILERLASEYKLDERHIRRIINPEKPILDPDWIDLSPEDAEALGLRPDDR